MQGLCISLKSGDIWGLWLWLWWHKCVWDGSFITHAQFIFFTTVCLSDSIIEMEKEFSQDHCHLNGLLSMVWIEPFGLKNVRSLPLVKLMFSYDNSSLKEILFCSYRYANKNIERHAVDTIVSWPNPKQWVIVHTSDLMMIIRQSIYILSIITREMGKLKTYSPTYCIMNNGENMLNLTHSTKYICRHFISSNHIIATNLCP